MKMELFPDCFQKKSEKYRHYFTFAILLFLVVSAFTPRLKALVYVYFIFIAIPGIVWFFMMRGRVFSWSYEWCAWALFLVWVAIQNSFFAVVVDARYLRYTLWVAIFIMVAACFVRPCVFRSERLIRSGLWTLVAFSAFSLIMDWSRGVWLPGGRLFFWQPSTSVYFHAYLLNMLFALLLPRLLSSGKWLEFLCVFCAVVFVNAVCFSSRSALLGTVTALFAGFIFIVRHHHKMALRYAGFLVFLIVLAAIVFQEFSFLHGLLARADSHRYAIWSEHLGYLRQYDVMFLGLGRSYTDVLLPAGQDLMRPHNLFLSIFVYHGLWALLLFLALCVLTLRRAWRNQDAWGSVVLTGLVEAAFMSEHIIEYPSAIWCTVLLPMAMVLNANPAGSTAGLRCVFSPGKQGTV
jgi:O-antigen ligase